MPEETTEYVSETTETEPNPTIETVETQSEPLGEGGIKALEMERKARREAEKATKLLQAEIENLKQQTMTESERAIAEARKEAREEALEHINKKIVLTEVKAAASGKLSDPTDALKFIDVTQFEVDEEGNINAKAINKAIEELIKSKPYLAAHRGSGDIDGGARGKPTSQQNDMNTLIRKATGRL
jgi:hypothetical protein